MGSLFSSPSVPTYSPVQYVPPQSVQKNSANEKPTPSINQDSDDENQVKDVIKRSARGRNSLIQTSYRGVLGEANALVPQRKSLLGE